MNKNTYCVYMHKNKINGKVYVGSTKHGDDPSKRWRNGKVYKGKFRDDIDKFGWNNFDHYIIQDNLSLEEASKLEKLNIIAFNTTDSKYGYNINIAGNTHNKQSAQKISKSLKGRKMLEEAKHKMSKAQKQLYADGYVNPMQGKHHSEESIQKISKNVSKAQLGLIWLHKDSEEIQVKPEYLEEYLNKGYTRGRFFDKIWIHNDTKTKMIHKYELQDYLNNGWNKGRFKSSKEAKSMFKKGGDYYE